MSPDCLGKWEEGIFSNVFGDALNEVDKAFMTKAEILELHRLMSTGWIREAIVVYLCSRFLAIHDRAPVFVDFIPCVLDLVILEPALVENRSTPLVVAIGSTLALAAWQLRVHQMEVARN